MSLGLALASPPANDTVPVTMLTTEIAELTGKRHDHVMRDAKKMLIALGIDAPTFGGVYLDAKGEQRPCFVLPKRETMILVTGYSVPMRAAVIDRLNALELELRARPSELPSPTPLADRIGALVKALSPPIVNGVCGYVKRAVVVPLNTLTGKVVELRSYLDDRFRASRERDILLLGKSAEIAGSTEAVREELRQIKVFLTRKRSDPSVETVGDMVTISEAQDIVGVPEQIRSSSLSTALSSSARVWFAENGRTLRALTMSGGSTRWLFERAAVERWWSACGIAVADKRTATRGVAK